jgi:hypothetical protein
VRLMQTVSSPKESVSIEVGNPETLSGKSMGVPSSGIKPPPPVNVWEKILLKAKEKMTDRKSFFIGQQI